MFAKKIAVTSCFSKLLNFLKKKNNLKLYIYEPILEIHGGNRVGKSGLVFSWNL